MRVAVSCENGKILPHFAQTEQIRLYQVEGGQVLSSQSIHTGGGADMLPGFLQAALVDVLICGAIEGGVRGALMGQGIALYPGVVGEADRAVEALLAGSLSCCAGQTCAHRQGEHDGHACSGCCGQH